MMFVLAPATALSLLLLQSLSFGTGNTVNNRPAIFDCMNCYRVLDQHVRQVEIGSSPTFLDKTVSILNNRRALEAAVEIIFVVAPASALSLLLLLSLSFWHGDHHEQ